MGPGVEEIREESRPNEVLHLAIGLRGVLLQNQSWLLCRMYYVVQAKYRLPLMALGTTLRKPSARTKDMSSLVLIYRIVRLSRACQGSRA